MAAAPVENASALGRGERVRTAPVRQEERVSGVCVVEYDRYPRLVGTEIERIGFTRDVSRSGLCIGVDEPEPVGALVLFRLRCAGTQPGPIWVARVAWCHRTRDERHWLGLRCLSDTRPHREIHRD